MNLTEELLGLYWSEGDLTIDADARIRKVVFRISEKIRTWAPSKGQAKICHLAINEVADRLLREMETENPY